MRKLTLLLALALSSPALARTSDEPYAGGQRGAAASGSYIPEPSTAGIESSDKQPLVLRLLIHPVKNGMLIRLPIVDTDPNRGITFGVLPVWIINDPKEDRIVYMHAPSLTYNPTFKLNATYRFYYYPTKDSSYMARASISQVLEKELFFQYDNSDLFGKKGEWGEKLQYNVDAGHRFFGFGPATNKKAITNYVQNDFLNQTYFGLPFVEGKNWYWTTEHRLNGTKIADGPNIPKVPGITALFPNDVPGHYHQVSAFRGYVTYDSLDSSVTPTRGTYAEMYAESSQRAWASEYTFQRYSADLRHFLRFKDEDKFITAMRVKFEQVVGNGVPLWQKPYLGGKYIFPAYGDGRYTDLGLLSAQIEERITLFSLKTAGVMTKFEVAPFAGVGTVFDTPGRMQKKYARPLFGVGLRAVAPPQVVGSIDFGVGQEGMSTFMDINYPF